MAWFVLLPTASVPVEGSLNIVLDPDEISEEAPAVDLQSFARSVATCDRGMVNLSITALRRFNRCTIMHRWRILGRMRGYELGWQIRPPWSDDAFMTMLLDSDERRYSQTWINTFVACVLPRAVHQIPQVAAWAGSARTRTTTSRCGLTSSEQTCC